MNSMWFLLVGNLRVLHERRTTMPTDPRKGQWQSPAGVDFCVEHVAYLCLAQQEALDAPLDWLVAYELLDGEAVLGGSSRPHRG